MGVACDFEGGRTLGGKVVAPKATQPRGVWEHALRKFLNLESRKCHFQGFPQDIFSKLIRRKARYCSS